MNIIVIRFRVHCWKWCKPEGLHLSNKRACCRFDVKRWLSWNLHASIFEPSAKHEMWTQQISIFALRTFPAVVHLASKHQGVYSCTTHVHDAFNDFWIPSIALNKIKHSTTTLSMFNSKNGIRKGCKISGNSNPRPLGIVIGPNVFCQLHYRLTVISNVFQNFSTILMRWGNKADVVGSEATKVKRIFHIASFNHLLFWNLTILIAARAAKVF